MFDGRTKIMEDLTLISLYKYGEKLRDEWIKSYLEKCDGTFPATKAGKSFKDRVMKNGVTISKGVEGSSAYDESEVLYEVDENVDNLVNRGVNDDDELAQLGSEFS